MSFGINTFEKHKLTKLRTIYGAMSSLDALDAAIEAEEFKRLVGPFDFAFEKYARDQLNYTEYALLLEKEEQQNVSA